MSGELQLSGQGCNFRICLKKWEPAITAARIPERPTFPLRGIPAERRVGARWRRGWPGSARAAAGPHGPRTPPAAQKAAWQPPRRTPRHRVTSGHLGLPRVRSSHRAEDLVPRGRPPVADVARVLLLPVSVFRTVTEYVQVICKR